MRDKQSSAAKYPLQDIEAYARFRRALRRPDQEALDSLTRPAQEHLASAIINHTDIAPFEALLVCMLIELHKEIHGLRRKVDKLVRAQGEQDGLKFE